jgi:hypothetical protein
VWLQCTGHVWRDGRQASNQHSIYLTYKPAAAAAAVVLLISCLQGRVWRSRMTPLQAVTPAT